MFTLDWNDPQTFWLNVTNVVLALVTLASVVIIAFGVGQELLGRLRRRIPILRREPDTHALRVPELGLTMADGGEPIDKKPEQRRQ